jgi:hypothetical protein
MCKPCMSAAGPARAPVLTSNVAVWISCAVVLLWCLLQDMACADDRQIVATIWAHIELLLNSGQGADATVRCEQQLLCWAISYRSVLGHHMG